MDIQFNAEKRDAKGTGASRRLRRDGRVPGIVYGAEQDAQQITLDHNEIYHLLRKEAFHASVLTMNLGGEKSSVVLRDAQWHPYKQLVMHLDFQRVKAGEKLHLKVPLHFVNDEVSPGVKLQNGLITHVMNEIDVQCLPKDLPEYLEVDLKDIEAGQSIHISHLKLPAGVDAVLHGEDDPVVVSCVPPRGGVAAEGEEAEGEEGGEAPAAE
ncbi:50S ribosomal protein L25/general stress protein Ctc [Nitrogeniibacter mangrovi]|uniref:Large ribosomal subunit protein bL25 n=1 Tax=Nitrogeniibacter mangrovi TaxID=2016596 RepID=A0A6C1B5A7_9RHOO|nr:50S ribosomal protein L25/general stress protein Ctc [Nitrogeniibacter mangrovi]QID18882.1 50S ribosomal protein L25/general stress protein Ctc [Nitrogeniibacter mangrovi]